MKAKESPKPPLEDLFKHVLAKSHEHNGESEMPRHIRMPNYENSYWAY
jgi:hypothetical protein